MNKDDKVEFCVNIIKNFLEKEFGEKIEENKITEEQLKKMFKYCLIKSAYSQNDWNKILESSKEYLSSLKTEEVLENFKENRSKNEFPELLIKYEEFYGNEEYLNKSIFENHKGDADRLQISYAIYYLLWKRIGIDIDINKEKIQEIYFENKDNKIMLNGDTLNTRDTICSYGNSLNDKLIKSIKDKNNLKQIIKKAEDFRWNYETFGNFMPITSGNESLNNNRSIVFKDQFDLYLKAVKEFYYNNLETNYENIFSESLEKNKEYFKIFGTFSDYVKYNYLDVYIKDGEEVKNLFKREKAQVLPKDFNQIVEYFSNAENIIKSRANLMIKELKKVLENYYKNKTNCKL